MFGVFVFVFAFCVFSCLPFVVVLRPPMLYLCRYSPILDHFRYFWGQSVYICGKCVCLWLFFHVFVVVLYDLFAIMCILMATVNVLVIFWYFFGILHVFVVFEVILEDVL